VDDSRAREAEHRSAERNFVLLVLISVLVAIPIVGAHRAGPSRARPRRPARVASVVARPPAQVSRPAQVEEALRIPWRVQITSCTQSSVEGVLTNLGAVTNTYIVAVSDDAGSFELGDGDAEIVNLPPGATTQWVAPVTFSNAPTGPVSCSVLEVTSNNWP